MHFPVGAPPGPGHIPWLLSLPKFQMQCHWQFLVFLPTLYFLANFAVSLSFRIGFLGTTHTSVFYRWQTKNHQQASERSFGHDSPTPQPCVCCQIKIRHLKKKKKNRQFQKSANTQRCQIGSKRKQVEGEQAGHSTLFLFGSDHFGGEGCNIYCISLCSPTSLNIKKCKKKWGN